MNMEGAESISEHSHKHFNLDQKNVTFSSSPNDAHHGGVSQQLIRQNVDDIQPKKVSVTKIKFITNNNTEGNHYLHRNQAEIPLIQTNTRLRPSKKPRQHRVWFTWIVSTVQICVFIAELAKNWLLTGRPIETKLSVNPLFGPTPFVLINMGACFSPCMHTVNGITNVKGMGFPCPNTTTLTRHTCTLSDLCGFNGVSSIPNQWYRFIIPIFLHAGIVHIGLNLFCQLVLGAKIERKIGMLRLAIIYFASGIFGFVLSANFGTDGSLRVGCSGSVFSIFALFHLDLYYNWKSTKHRRRQFVILNLDIIFSFALGLLPSLDNFGHLGGFFMGLLLGLTLMDSPANFRRCKKVKELRNDFGETYGSRVYRKFFHNRPKNWWVWWLVRFIAFTAALVIFVVLVNNFYTHKIKCAWCKYISCLPIKNWCDV